MNRFPLTILALAFTACETIIDVDVPKDPPKLVINGFVSPDSIVRVHLSESRFILDQNPFKNVSGVRIELFEDNISRGHLKELSGGWYTMNMIPKPLKSYTILADSPSHGLIEATANIPSKVEIIEVRINDQAVVRDGDEVMEIEIIFKDPPDQNNFYEFRLLADEYNESYVNHAPVEINSFYQSIRISFADPALQEDYFSSGSLVFNDLTFNGKEYTLRIFADAGHINNLSRREETFLEDANIYRYSSQDSLKAVLTHTEEAYYLFKKSSDSQNWNDGNPFAEPVTVYSNVINGFGIFAGRQSNLFDVNIDEIIAANDGN